MQYAPSHFARSNPRPLFELTPPTQASDLTPPTQASDEQPIAFDEEKEKRAEKRAVTELFDSNYLKDPVKESKCPQCAACRCDNSFRFHLVEIWKLEPWSFRHPLLRPRPAQQLALSSSRMGWRAGRTRPARTTRCASHAWCVRPSGVNCTGTASRARTRRMTLQVCADCLFREPAFKGDFRHAHVRPRSHAHLRCSESAHMLRSTRAGVKRSQKAQCTSPYRGISLRLLRCRS